MQEPVDAGEFFLDEDEAPSSTSDSENYLELPVPAGVPRVSPFDLGESLPVEG